MRSRIQNLSLKTLSLLTAPGRNSILSAVAYETVRDCYVKFSIDWKEQVTCKPQLWPLNEQKHSARANLPHATVTVCRARRWSWNTVPNTWALHSWLRLIVKVKFWRGFFGYWPLMDIRSWKDSKNGINGGEKPPMCLYSRLQMRSRMS